MNFGSHLDATVVLARDLVNELTPGMVRGRERGELEEGEMRVAVAEVLADRPNRRRAWEDASRHDLVALRRMADRLRQVFTTVEARDVDAAAAELNDLLDLVRARPELSAHDGEPWHLHFHATEAGQVASIAAGCATALAMVVGSPAADRLGVCHAAGCDRVYVDTTKNASKRFCSTACQNRAKAAAFRARQRAGA